MNKLLKITIGTAMTALVFKSGVDFGMWATKNYMLATAAAALSEACNMNLEDSVDYITRDVDMARYDDCEIAKEIFKKLVKHDLGIETSGLRNDEKEI